jgi:hypothetical protein
MSIIETNCCHLKVQALAFKEDIMIGTTLSEVKEKIFDGHEIEFTYNGCEYSIENEFHDNMNVAKIWKCCDTESECIACAELKSIDDVDILLNNHCFGGKSFIDIESSVMVDNIF